MTNLNDDNKNYEVGYKRPPKEYRFKKGKSGNPKGRPKVHKTFLEDLQEESEELITIMQNGKTIKATKQRIFIKKLFNSALTGDKTAIRQLSELLSKNPSKAKELTKELSETDEKILKEFIERQVEHE